MEKHGGLPIHLKKIVFMSQLDCLKLKISQTAGDEKVCFCSHILKKTYF